MLKFNINKVNLFPLTLFGLPGIIISFYFIINLISSFSGEDKEWSTYIFIYIFSFSLFFLSFTNLIRYFRYIFFYFSLVFFLFIFINFSYFYLAIITFLLSLILTLICKKISLKKFLVFDYLIHFLFFFTFIKLSTDFFYLIKFDEFFFKNLDFISNNTELLLKKLEYFFVLIKLDNLDPINFLQIIYPIYLIIIFIIITLLFFIFFKKNYQISILNKYWWFLPSIIFFLESFSTSSYFLKESGGAMLHWQLFIGVLQMMSQNGYLLWDTPSQYGFLSLLALYLMPFNDPWLKVYILNGLLNFVVGILFFKLFWNNNKNIAWYIISLLITWFLVYVISGGGNFENASAVPSDRPLRFIWLFIISYSLLILSDKKIDKQLMFIVPIWLAGFMWSIESAFYVSCTLFPYIIYLLFFSELSIKEKVITISSFLVSLIVAIIFISTYYYVNIGNLPDFYSFIEYAISWTGGFFSTRINSIGVIWIPIILLSWIMIEILCCKKNKEKFLLISFWSGLWAVCSYAIGNSDDVNMFRHTYIYFFFFILVINKINLDKYKVSLLLPIFFSFIFFTFSSLTFYIHIYKTISNQNYNLKNTKFEILDEYNEILSYIKPEDTPLIYIETGRYRFFNPQKMYIDKETGKEIALTDNIWLPLNPSFVMDPLTNDRMEVYMRRWMERNNYSKGWIISPVSNEWIFTGNNLYQAIDKTLVDYKKIKQFNYGNLKAVLYEKNL